jgi:hypothetical protein
MAQSLQMRRAVAYRRNAWKAAGRGDTRGFDRMMALADSLQAEAERQKERAARINERNRRLQERQRAAR